MPPSAADVDERLTLAIESINKKLDQVESFRSEVSGKLGAINSSLSWIKTIGAFVGAAVLALGGTFAGSIVWLGYRAGHIEEAVASLKTEKVERDVQLGKVMASLESIEKRLIQEQGRHAPSP